MSLPRLITILLLFAAGCGTQEKKSGSTDATETAHEAFFNNLRPPAETAATLKATYAPFDSTLLNDPRVWTSYSTNEVKAAANLGIYLSDLNYSVAYDQKKTTRAIFPAAQQLSRVAGIEKTTLDFLTKRYNDNINQNDTAMAVIGSLYLKATRDLKGTKREKMAGIATSAYLIENLHIVLGMITSAMQNRPTADAQIIPLFQMVQDQKAHVSIIYNFLKSATDVSEPDNNPNYPFYTQAFQELIEVYGRLQLDTMIANKQVEELLNDNTVIELAEKVDAIRNKIVSVQPE
jgi:hypothetical protein